MTRGQGLAAAWVLLLAACAGRGTPAWHEENGYRWHELTVRHGERAGFTRLDPGKTGIAFRNDVAESTLVRNRILAQGGGVAFADVDGDGLLDLYLCRTVGPNALYRNLGGWRFAEEARARGVAAADRNSTGAAFADVDGDGDPDLVLAALGGPNAVFLNDGTGHFTERELPDRAGSTTLALADVDGDGDLDLFVTNYKAYTTLDRMSPQQRGFDQVVREVGPQQFEVLAQYRGDYKLIYREELAGYALVQRADPDFFYRNEGGRFVREPMAKNPRFRDESGRPLAEEREDFGLAGRFTDVNGDGAPDLYVANDFEDPDEFWINDGKGGFRLIDRAALRSTSNSGMAVDFSDVDRDGRLDLFEVDMLSADTRRLRTQIPTHTAVPSRPGDYLTRPQMQRNALQLNRGDGTFAEVSRLAGVEGSGWSWSVLFLDVDLDGWEDILVGTGHPWDLMDGDTQMRLRNRLQDIDWRRMSWEFPSLAIPNYAFRNRGDLAFEDVSRAWNFGTEDDVSHGMAAGDLDGDGDLDVVVNRLNAPAAVLRNEAGAPRLAVRLVGTAPNTAGIGAAVRVLGGPVPIQEKEITAGGLYLSHNETLASFATGRADSVTIEVRWRDGRVSRVPGARPDRLYEIHESGASAAPASSSAVAPPPLFTDATRMLGGHRHTDVAFDDYTRQLLLPNSFAQLGPGAAWVDLDGDGDDDLVIGTGKGGRPGVFRNDGGTLRPWTLAGAAEPGDMTGLAAWFDPTGKPALLAGVSNYEALKPDEALAIPAVVTLDRAGDRRTIPGDSASVGPIAVADYDGDGDLDLFVGGRIFAGGYPLSPSSRLFLNDGGAFRRDSLNAPIFAGVGMVSSAVFSDVDGDGDPDLLLALEWGPIKLYRNVGGTFAPIPLRGIENRYSRWNGIATGDFDGDGRLDIAATSWGRNTQFGADSVRPLLLYFGQFNDDGRPDILLGRYDERLKGVAPLTSYARMGLALPEIAVRLRTFNAFADATVEQVLGLAAGKALKLGATTFDHLVALNRGDHWEVRPLPEEAQFAPAFAVLVQDFTGDGHEDLFLAQNFFPTEVSIPRYDAGRGLLLAGDGRGGFRPVPGPASGIEVYGDQRGAAATDFDGDGRVDLVVPQNGADTRLFRNTGARPGLRVRLEGPRGNPAAIGAQVRLSAGGTAGPIREVQAGSGYWSQQGLLQVLGIPEGATPTEVRVRWPGGRESTVAVPAGAREVTARE